MGAMDAATSAENEATVKLNLKTMSIMMNVQSITLENTSLCESIVYYVYCNVHNMLYEWLIGKCFSMYVCLFSMLRLLLHDFIDVTEGEMVMLYGSLSPPAMGSITCYLPVLVSDIA